MTAERWQRIKSLFGGAASLAPHQRDDFLQQECVDDPSLISEVRKLLANEARTGDFPQLGAATAPISSFAAGDLAAGRFRIVRLLGRGGMGEVYEAEDTLLGERVALKTIRREIAADPAILSRFRHEIQLARRITNLNVCRIFDLEMHLPDSTAPTAFLTMELLLGETLAARLARSGAMSPNEALPLARQMAAGLEAAHQCGVIHRDFKSGNVMLVPGRDGSQRAVITDFGLARGPGLESGLKQLTDSGKLVGTLDYMAPEQLEKGETSYRSDIYSMGLVLYEMVTGALPFHAETPIGSALLRVRSAPPSPRSVKPELSRTWEAVIQRCLECDPARRFSSPAEVARDLEHDTLPPAATRKRWPHLGGSLALAGLALLVAAGTIIWLMFPKPVAVPWKTSPLTSFPGTEFHPAFSPDGELIAFAWDGSKRNNVDIYVQQIASGTLSRLTTDPAPDVSPAWSPDNRQIAFRRVLPEGFSQIIVKSYLGGSERKLAEWEYTGEQHFRFMPLSRDLCWSPDGKWLVATGKTASSAPSSLFAILVETRETRMLMSPPAVFAGDSQPALSPDGRTLAFVRAATPSRSELYVVAVSEGLIPAGQPKQITFDNRMVTNPAWTADGKTIIFTSDRSRAYTPTLWRISIPGSASFEKLPEPERVASVADGVDDAAVSRDGRRLAYTQASEDLNIWEVRLPEGAGGTSTSAPLIASTRAELMPDFAPDGNKIAFQSNRSGDHAIWTCERDGSTPVQLTSFGGDPHWSPDSKQIVFAAQREDKSGSDIYLISAPGGAPHRLTHCSGNCSSPRWSRDGKWIYYSLLQGVGRQLWKIPVDGGNPVEVSHSGGMTAMESVDGKYIYYTKSGGLYANLWKVPVGGGTETQVLAKVTFGRNFTVTDRGIYFIPWRGRAGPLVISKGPEGNVIEFLSFASSTVKTIFTTQKPVYIGLAVSPEGRSLLFTQADRAESDLWMVENFK